MAWPSASPNVQPYTRLVGIVTTQMLLKTVVAGRLHPEQLITHYFPLSQIMRAYDTFGNAQGKQALKVILSNE